MLRGGIVELAPAAEVATDVERFERGDDSAYGGELLPDQPYEQWALGPRARLRERRLAVMRSEGSWEEVLREDAADEEAHRALMRRHVASGDRPAAARQFRLLRDELSRLGAEPSEETLALRRELTRGPAVRAARLLHAPVEGRERELASASAALRRAAAADRRRAAGDGLARDRQDAPSSRPCSPRRRSLASTPCAAPPTRRRAARRTRRSWRRSTRSPPGARSWPARSPTAHKLRWRDSCPRCAARQGLAEEAVHRHRVFSAVAQLLAQAAAERGLVLAIDDLHAADEATAALVHHLARSGAAERLLVIAGMRDEPLPEAAALVRSSLLERGAAVELALGPLDRTALAAVAQRAATRPLPSGALALIERSAAGNPFFAEELAASVDASGEVTVPPRLREVVARRLERLEPFGERLLAALAVIDDGFTGAELTALSRSEGVDEALGEAEAAGVLESVRGRYRFRHALVREELAARLPEEMLRSIHADAAALLAAEDAPPETVA